MKFEPMGVILYVYYVMYAICFIERKKVQGSYLPLEFAKKNNSR